MSSTFEKLKGKMQAFQQGRGQSSTENKRYDLKVTLGCTGTGEHCYCKTMIPQFGTQTAHIYKNVLQNHLNDWGKAIAEHPARTIDNPLPVELEFDVCAAHWDARHLIDQFMSIIPDVEVERGMKSPELSWLMIGLNKIENVTATLQVIDTEVAAIHQQGTAQGVNTHYQARQSP